ncbi:MAG: hypothetical protein MPN21_02895 [Thermoanaerobaculia bacterium]|nr:hypothetical protein [Thermoanaerobaculia bacterium]
MHSRFLIFSVVLFLLPSALLASAERQRSDVAEPIPIVKGVAPIDTIDDGSFEDGSPNSFWTEASSNFGTPLCDAISCGGTGGGTGPNTGLFWAWFGGIAAAETGSVSQDIQMTDGGTATLDFFLEIPAASGNGVDFLELRVDGNVEWSVLENAAGFATYAPVSVDLSAYADGAVHTLEFTSTITGAPALSNFFLDDVSLSVTPPSTTTAADIPTLDQIGLGALLLLIAFAGVAVMRHS